MATHKQALKRHKQSLKKRDRNRGVRSKVRTLTKKFRASLEDPKADSKAELATVISALERAGSKGVLPPGRISRSVGRLTKALARKSA